MGHLSVVHPLSRSKSGVIRSIGFVDIQYFSSNRDQVFLVPIITHNTRVIELFAQVLFKRILVDGETMWPR